MSAIDRIYIPSTKTPPQSTSPAALEALLLQRIPTSHLCLSTPQPPCLCKGVKYLQKIHNHTDTKMIYFKYVGFDRIVFVFESKVRQQVTNI